MSRHRRVDQERIAELEREQEAELRRKDAARDRAIAAAECARDGHVVPDDPETIEITVLERVDPIRRLGPYCSRCGADLSEGRHA